MSSARFLSRASCAAVFALAISVVPYAAAGAAGPVGDNHSNSTTPIPTSRDFAQKQALANWYASYASGSTNLVSPDILPPPPPPPPSSYYLDTRTREQDNDYYCGPASGQVVINFTRGYLYDNLDGENTSTNWRTQATLAGWMGTTQSGGTNGSGIVAGLNHNNGAVEPYSNFYVYQHSDSGLEFDGKITAAIAGYDMPVVPDVMPHKANADYFLPGWPDEVPGAKHWIVIRGYDGLWDGTDNPQAYFNDSSSEIGPGRRHTGLLTMWMVTNYLYGKVVW